MADKTYIVTATLNGTVHEFDPVEAPNKAEAISEIQSSLSVRWDTLTDGDAYFETEFNDEGISCPLEDLFGQDLMDLIMEKFCEEAVWSAKKEKS
jgi:hypothetical protein